MRAFLIAGEVSGDRLGGALMRGLQNLQPGITFDGIGGAEMQAQGLTSLFSMETLSVMGLAEILPRYFDLKARIRQTADAVIATDPDVLITIDSPDFCLRVAKIVKAARPSLRIVHYVAPTVWAWRPGRAEKMARVVDHVLALFPFEPPYMTAAGMECDFVGHPVVAEPLPSAEDQARLRDRLGLGQADLLLVLPGSRRGEVTRLAEPFGDALRIFLAHRPMRVVIPAPGAIAELVRQLSADWPGDPVVIDAATTPDAARLKRGAFGAASLALAASGTVSLELAAARTPMVIGYRFSPLTWMILKRMMRVDTGTLVNLVSETRVVPERFGPDCTGENLARDLSRIATDPAAQHDAMRLTMERLGQGGEDPGLRAARAVLRGLARG